MIIGDYYINNFLVLAIVLLLFGGLGLLIVPGDAGTGQTDQNQSSGNYELLVSGQGLQAGSFQDVTLVDDTGDPVSGISVLLNGQEVGTTGDDGSVTFEVPNQSTVTVSASSSQVDFEKNFQVESSGNSGENGDGSGNNDSDGDSQEDGGDGDNDNSTDDSSDGNNTDNPDNSIEADINRLSPENQQLNSASFEASYELQAENASYKLSLAEQKKASGNLDGEKTVNEQVSMPFNGTAGLEMEIVREGEVLASENLIVNYTAEGSDDGSNDSSGGEDPAGVTADLSVPSSVHVGDALEADASGSTGDIINYTWNFGEGTEETREASTIEHTYSSEGTYEFVVTVNGENSTEDNALETIEVRSLQEPLINFQSPTKGYVTDQSSIDYEFVVENASSDAEYTVLIDQSATVSGNLEEGSSTVQRDVEVPATVFNTSVQVSQGEETYTSERRRVDARDSEPQPKYSLVSPEEGQSLETVDSQMDVELKYEITDRNWASSANLTLENESSVIFQNPVSVASGNHTEKVSGLTSGEYSYSLEIEGDGNSDKKSSSFEIREIEPYYNIAEWNETVLDNGYEVRFNLSYNVSDSSLLEANIYNSSGTEVRSYSRFVDDVGSLNFTKSFMEPKNYYWYLNITSGEETVLSTKPNEREFETVESNPNDN
ncbi:hypothetical protein AQV86_02905 [Nanohaloarchaea archaeon SG9]|nr:hypothetical protein AQV86_02905 [Nanohaloarchaea archaeon SG9]